MTSHLIIPKSVPEQAMTEVTGMKRFVGRKVQKTVDFMGDKIKISKLSVAEVMDIQAQAKELEEATKANPEADNTDGLKLLQGVIRASAEGAAELSDEDFETMPMEELSKLSEAIMKFSGIGAAEGK